MYFKLVYSQDFLPGSVQYIALRDSVELISKLIFKIGLVVPEIILCKRVNLTFYNKYRSINYTSIFSTVTFRTDIFHRIFR